MTSFFGELRRRNVVKVAVAYAVVGWLLVQVAATFFPALQLPEWTVTFVAGLVILGFPLALILSWAYELTPDGMERTKSVPLSESIVRLTGRKLDFVIIGALVLALGFVVLDSYLLEDSWTETVEAVATVGVESAAPNLGPAERDVLPNSIAILPFVNLSPDPDDAFFAAGIHEELLDRLAKIKSISVIARPSVMQYAESPPTIPIIADELNVQLVMTGSVRYAGDDVRISVQLIDGSSNMLQWGEIYDRKLSDIFAIQADLGTRIAAALEAEVLPYERERLQAPSTDSTDAYALYLRSRERNTTTLLERARLLDAAIEIDPDFALAYGHRALVYAQLIRYPDPGVVGDPETLALENAGRALMLDPSIAVAHAALAYVHEGHWRGADALAEYELALEISPNDPAVLGLYAALKRNTRYFDEAIEIGRRVVELDPQTSSGYHFLGHSYRQAKDFENATINYELALALVPSHQGALLQTANLAILRGDYETAVERLRLLEEYSSFIPSWQLPRVAYLYAKAGHREDTERLIAELESRDQEAITPIIWGLAYVALGDYEAALVRINQALEENAPGDLISFNSLRDNLFFNPVLDEDPRFRELRDRIPHF